MRVLLTTDTVGGVWTFTRELAQQLLLRGDEVALVSLGRAPNAVQKAWAQGLVATSAGCFEYSACDAPLEWMQNNDQVWQQGSELLLQVVDRFQPDILHSSQFCWGALPAGVPKLITAHSDVRSWAAACHPQGLSASRWLTLYESLVQDGLDGAHTIVAPTAWMRDALRQSFRIGAPFEVIPNGRSVALVSTYTERKLQAVSVGRLWDEGKGLAVLNEFAAPLPIVLAGERSFENESADLPSKVSPAGPLDEPSLLALFRTSSIYLATSRYEPFGLAPLEAALCGCAIVARDLPSFREVWGTAALYFNDAQTLKAILADLVSHPQKLSTHQAEATWRAQRFHPEGMAEAYRLLYRSLIHTRPGRSQAEELHAA